MNRVIVIGPSGAGKSTFARALRDKTGLPLIYLDMLWHLPDRTHISREEFDKRLGELLSGPRWIMDGDYSRTLERRLEACDTVFLFDLPVDLCLAGVESRRNTLREDMPWVETEEDPEFTAWIKSFPAEKLPKTYELLERFRQGREIHVFHSRAQAWEYLRALDENG